MGASINKVMIQGRLGQDPEVRYTTGGAATCTISVATSERWKDKTTGEQKEKSEWHRIVLWNKAAETVGEYFKKGDEIFVEGQLETRKWTDQAGVERYTTEIRASEFKFGEKAPGNKPAGQQGAQGQQQGQSRPQGQGSAGQSAPRTQQQRPAAQNQNNEPPIDFDDDIPF